MVDISLEDLQHIRTLARHGINQTVQHYTVKQLNDATASMMRLDNLIADAEDRQLKTVEIEQTLTNIEDKGNPDAT